MTRALTTKLLLLLGMVLGCIQMQAQGWEKKYSPDHMMGINTVYPTSGGDCLLTGWDITGPDRFQRIMKIDGAGAVIWVTDHDSITNTCVSNITQNGGLVSIGMGRSNNIAGGYALNALKVDSNGQKVWLKTVYDYLQPPTQGNIDIDTTDNGGFICTFTGIDTAGHLTRLHAARIDPEGNVLWQKTYYNSNTDTFPVAYNICNSKDGGFILTTAADPQGGLFIFKIDSNGNQLWQYPPTPVIPDTTWVSASIASDGNILLLSADFGEGGNNQIRKIDQQGNLLWAHLYTLPTGWSWYGQLIERHSNTFALIVTGRETIDIGGSPWTTDAYAMTFVDTAGNILYYKNIPTSNLGNKVQLYQAGYKSITTTREGGYMFGGWIEYDPENYSGYLIKMDSNAVVYPTMLSGYAYGDMNINCGKDSGEVFLSPVNVTLANTTDTFTVITADSGYFSLGLNTGAYSLQAAPPSPYWQASTCNATSVNLASGTDTSLLLGFTPIVSSPYILINGYLGPEVVWCRPTTYTVEYCNYGTAPFTGTIVITVDTMLTVDSASLQWASASGNQYTFNVDTLNIMQCATFKMYCTVHCNSELIGRTASIVSQAFQDTIITSPPTWDHSNIQMAVRYNQGGDSVTFTLANVGTGNMHTPSEMIVIEDNVILLHMPQQLPSGGQVTQTVPANGSTWRVTIPQTANNPYSTFATAGIEAAGTNTHGGISTGFFTQFPYNGYTSYQYNTCAEIKSAYDPNQKTVTPKGAGIQAFIDTTTKLEYVIDFQNTGNARAYTVTVIDTLPPYVNPATIRLEVSSNPCRMQLSGSNIVTFTFNNINLPDSSANFMGSMGFVKFGIDQKPNNALGTVINNKAGIYFDYNAPVVTNTATVRIGELLVNDIQVVYPKNDVTINAYPNPFKRYTIIKVNGEIFTSLQLNVYDLNSKLVMQQRVQNANQFMLYNNDLANGSYIFELTGDGKPVGKGKIVAE